MRRRRPMDFPSLNRSWFGKGRNRLIFLALALAVVAYRLLRGPASPPAPALQPCETQSGCFTGIVVQVVDGDTLDISGVRVRLVLVDAPERNTRQGPAATAYLRRLCPPGSPAWLQPDAWQPQDQYGRTLAAIWCGEGPDRGGPPVNAEMIRSGHARLYERYCRQSAFGGAPWAVELGCR